MKKIENEQFKGKGLNDEKMLSNVQFLNCTFDKCNLSEYRFTNCEFIDCVFTGCNFKNAFLALNKKYDSGKFINCLFITCNLTSTSFDFPIIDKCEFRNCKLEETNFGGSRFSDSRFIGELDSCFFRGYPIYSKGPLLSFSRFDPLKVPNEMRNVDFSQAKMEGVTFSHRIDLSHCTFPSGPDYVYIADLPGTMSSVKATIEQVITDQQDRVIATNLIDEVYYNKNMREQQNNFMDAFVLREGDQQEGNNLGERLFEIIKAAASK